MTDTTEKLVDAAQLRRWQATVEAAMNCIRGETPEGGISVDLARDMTLQSLRDLDCEISAALYTTQTGKECDANSTGTVRSTGLDNAQPPSAMTGAEIPVAWGEFYGDKCASVTLKPGRFNTVPLYRSQPAMAGTEALVAWIDFAESGNIRWAINYLLSIIDRLTGRSEGR